MNYRKSLILAGFALAIASACSKSPQPAPALPAVDASFNVGENTSVRSLAIDSARNRLWVGITDLFGVMWLQKRRI